MERLVTTSQAAQILGLSLQGIHYRIKNNQLKSTKKSGKLYVYINDDEQIVQNSIKSQSNINYTNQDYYIKELIKVKDEQIYLLKESIKTMKKQYKSEIYRLEKNQQRVVKIFDSEIKLLQSAFNEMKNIYKPQIKRLNKQYNTNQSVQKKHNTEAKKSTYISIKDFFQTMSKSGKSEFEIKQIIFEAIKNEDKRFIYDKIDKKILIKNENFSDLV